jgi:hypothetical protein
MPDRPAISRRARYDRNDSSERLATWVLVRPADQWLIAAYANARAR